MDELEAQYYENQEIFDNFENERREKERDGQSKEFNKELNALNKISETVMDLTAQVAMQETANNTA